MGNYLSSNLTYFEVNFFKWAGADANGNLCKSDAEITTAINSAYVQLALVNTYYDFDDYSQPVKTYFDDQIYLDLIYDFHKKNEVFVRESSVEQLDSFFRYSPNGDQSSFISKSTLLRLLFLKNEAKVVFIWKYD